ncbi:hypothetical protein DAPPUDRAFT_107850 [Daphnia pulex]|uniref:Uncharacterized protein n=1 Tax=Daphnia pulex TaxID=6669 RepID=E9GYF5_DAPPU|nr:hypothetical protein DAPPUDRAFT_107850 [Daphnia pulex]|eukprot:EFX75484.1 hypothetical protein DAPPUDRAFT_107850 [Daphnia pulex]
MHETRSRTAQLRAQEMGEQIDPVIGNQIHVNEDPTDAQGPLIIDDQQIDPPIANVDPAAQGRNIIDDQQRNGERQHKRPADYYRPLIGRLRGFIDNHRTQIETDLRNHQQQQRQNREDLELLLNERNEHLNQSERDLNAMVDELETDFRRQEDELIRRRDELDQRENQLRQREIRTNRRFHFNEQRTIYLHKFERTLMHRE